MSRGRILCALAVGLAAAGLVELQAGLPHPGHSDFADLYNGMSAWRHGQDPYAAVRAAHPDVALYYPLPALLLLLPLSWLPRVHAEAVFLGIGMGALAFAGWRRPLLAACMSTSALGSVVTGQWSPLMTASALLPSLGVVWACKPSVGAVLAAGYFNRRSLLGAAALTLLSFAMWPGWVAAWLPGLHHTVHVAPIQRLGGVVLLLALIRWRQPEARVLAALSCMPQTGALYDALPLFLVPRTRYQAYALVACMHLAAFAIYLTRGAKLSLVEATAQQWPILLGLCYLPALVILFLPAGPRAGVGRSAGDARESDEVPGPYEEALRRSDAQ